MLFQPERIDPKNFGHGYDVRSDVWSLGITLVGITRCVVRYHKMCGPSTKHWLVSGNNRWAGP